MANAGGRPTREPELPLAFTRRCVLPHPEPRGGPAVSFDEPALDKKVPTWNIRIPVYEWEIDPTDTERRCGSAELKYLGWDFRMWWEQHPADLVYASIQATHGNREPDWQKGWGFLPDQALAAKLVYDEQRQSIVCIHGTARNLRPFIEAFLMGFGLGPSF
jgi:hypothetical protein